MIEMPVFEPSLTGRVVGMTVPARHGRDAGVGGTAA